MDSDQGAVLAEVSGPLDPDDDTAMAGMYAHMMSAGDHVGDLEDDLGSLDAASQHSDDELKVIMDRGNDQASTAPPSAAKLRVNSSTSRRGPVGRAGPGGSGHRAGRRAAEGRGGSHYTGGDGGRGALTSGRETNKGRARPRKPHEPDPFLSINMLPVNKQQHHTMPTRERSAGSIKGQQIAKKRQMLNASSRQMRVPPGTPSNPAYGISRSRMGRSVSSAVSSEWNALVPKQRLVTAAVLDNPINTHVKVPFKHTINKPDMENVARPMTPGQTMKERTTLATYHMARTMARQRGEEEQLKSGRLLKGKLKPLNPVRIDGPTMKNCRGVVSEVNPYLTRESKTLERRQQILANMGNGKDCLDRPSTSESLHHTSIASDLSENREKDLQDEMETRIRDTGSLGFPQDGMCEPPNSLASASDPNFSNQPGMTLASTSRASEIFSDMERNGQTTVGLSTQEGMTDQGLATDQGRYEERERFNSTVSGRPNTAKAVRFADKDDVAGDLVRSKSAKMGMRSKEDKEVVFRNGSVGCKPHDDTKNHKDDEDDDGNGRDGQKGQGSEQNDHQGATGRGQAESQRSSSNGNNNTASGDGPTSNVAKFDDPCSTENKVLSKSASKSSPGGKVSPRPQSKTSQMAKNMHLIEDGQLDMAENKVLDFTVFGGGKESSDPKNDYYDKFARRPHSAKIQNRKGATSPKVQTPSTSKSRPRSAVSSRSSRRPLSASIVSKSQEPTVKFVIRPTIDGQNIILDSDEEEWPLTQRLSEMKCTHNRRPASARKHTPRETLSPRDLTQPAEFTIQGAKMAQSLKAGICTECGRPTNKIADYWEETGALICEVCDRRTRAEERRNCERLRQEVYRAGVGRGNYSQHDDVQKCGLSAVDTVLEVTQKGDQHGADLLANMEELEKSLGAVCLEIQSTLTDNKDLSSAANHFDTSDTSRDNDVPCTIIRDELDVTSVSDAAESDPLKDVVLDGEISKILTDVDADPSTMSQYQMKVYWYKEIANASQKKIKPEIRPDVSSGSIEDSVFDSLKTTMGQRSKDGEINTYSVMMMADQTDDLVADLMKDDDEQNLMPQNMQYFKGQRVPTDVGNGKEASGTVAEQLEVEGTAAKLVHQKQTKESSAVAPFAPVCFRINARPPSGYLYYFAYGANMNQDRMQTYLQRPIDEDRSWGLLYGFRLVFNKRGVDVEAGGFPNIELDSTSSVEGCLYLITSAELDQLDRYQGYPQHYDHAMLPVWLLNCADPDEYGVAQYCVPALVYVAKDNWLQKGCRPLEPRYAIDQCLKGGSDLLTPAYRQHLHSLETSLPIQLTA